MKNLSKPYIALLLFMPLISVAQIINKGLFKSENNTVVFFGNDFINDTGASFVNNGNLYLLGNLTNNSTTDATAGTTYFIENTPQLIGGTSAQVFFNNIEVDKTGNNVSIADNHGIIIKNQVKLVKGNLRLIGESQLIQTHSGISTNSGLGKLLKDQQGTASLYNYNYWSSPVNVSGTYSLSNILFDGTDSSSNLYNPSSINFTESLDGSPTNPIEISNNWIYKYINNNSGDYSAWTYIGSMGLLNLGEGFSMKGSGTTSPTQNYVFKGTPNSGDYNSVIGANKQSLLGNPYPSAIDANQFINDNAAVLGSGLLFWEHWGGDTHYTSGYQGGYAQYSLAGGTPATSHPSVAQTGAGTKTPGQYIPVGQGFFVNSNATGGNIIFSNNQRVFQTEGTTSVFIRQSNSKKTNNVNQRIRLGHTDAAGYKRQILLTFNNQTTDDFDILWDDIMPIINPNDMYWGLGNLKLAIQARPFRQELEIPIGIVSESLQTHKITLDSTEDFDNPIFLKDNLTNTYFNLTTNDFSVDLPAGEYLNRFSIVFEDKTLSVSDLEFNKYFNVYYSSTNAEIIISNTKLPLKNIQIYNSNGQLITNLSNIYLTNNEFKIPFNNPKGVYFIKINTEKGQFVNKLIN